MLKIRSNCFETNSSSTHALCLDVRNNYPKYTKEHLEAFTDVVYPFSPEEASKFNEPHVFFELKDKIRYFWTIFVRECLGCSSQKENEFMCKLQTLVPNASFAYRFPKYEENVWFRNNAAYMEDAEYVLRHDEYNTDSVSTWLIGEIEAFLLNGVIVFGDRDRYDYVLCESKIKLFIQEEGFKVVREYTG